jgi:exopolyphosphatase/guanosine-5'-triphosphate,3'-diphosphate pyrophosphatase
MPNDRTITSDDDLRIDAADALADAPPSDHANPDHHDDHAIRAANAEDAVIADPERPGGDDLPEFIRRRGEVVRRPPPMKFGAIDIGTNSIHLMMVEITPEGDFHTIGRDREMVQLGRGGMVEHVLTPRAMEDGLAALTRFSKMARLKGIHDLRAVATSAVREARNGGDFVELVDEQINLSLEVISAEEEARLIYLAVRHTIDLGEDDNLIVDIGGGSVEIVVGNAGAARQLCSAKLGSLRLAETFMKADPPTMAELKTVRRHIRTRLKPIFKKIGALRPVRCIGTSGTISSIAAVCAYRRGVTEIEPVTRLSITADEVKTLIGELRRMTREQRAKVPGIDAKRVDAILPACILLSVLMRTYEVNEIDYCDRALREGIVLDYLANHGARLRAHTAWPDPRMRSVVSLGERCRYHRGHAEQVARLATSMFDQLRPLHRLNDAHRELLMYACLLHDIGYQISHRSHHKHSYYLIRNGDLQGFGEREIEIIANIARYHRKGRPRKSHYSYKNLDPRDRPALRKMVALLRLANALDRTHYSVVDSVTCRTEHDCIEITVNTEKDAELELWHARRQADQVERELGCRIDVRHASEESAGSEST